MELNKDIELFILEDWIGNELGEFNNLDDLEEKISELENNDKDVQQAREFLNMVDYQLGNDKINMVVEHAIEELQTMVREDLYAYGLSDEGKVIGIQFG